MEMKKWYFCPICHKGKLGKFDFSKKIEGFFVKCKVCRNEIEIKNESQQKKVK